MRKKDETKRQKIIAAAIQTVRAEGFHGASISKIAQSAGVSPATVYVYFENKGQMLRDIFTECIEDLSEALLDGVDDALSGTELVRTLIQHYYLHMLDYPEAHYYFEQFMSCPALLRGIEKPEGGGRLYRLLHDRKARGELEEFRNDTLFAMLFAPVKVVAKRHILEEKRDLAALDELIRVTQKALLR